MYVLNESCHNNNVKQLIEICKSSSMSMGYKLRTAHYQLGEIIAEPISKSSNQHKNYVVLILMRAGLCFGNGIADKLEQLGSNISIIFVNDDKVSNEDLEIVKDKDIIIVDAVINSGKSVFSLIDQLPNANSVKLATTVIPSSSTELLESYDLYTVRVSNNQYEGAKVQVISDGKGPDTGDRLFSTYK
ncbi:MULTISPECIES: uracil phosphoribosyltransferase [Shewanella]|jgi:uracil phosphoribosyltransferase|nr:MULTISPECIES: uracil phosphoribosyltransferase [Shewanella]MDL3985664.1 phosphoribosyltransferase [Shewanella xiamenensis]QRK78417.1 phosphoribosyltransferase [Shewanella sp. LZH-2]TVL20439.1 phosphoribosyl transferase [Shewanella xiamenensis]TVL20555.1 phosphoribosyl transferase [Shewanella xiamenensis]TVL26458.1 phosphoribosyl transferase [Shewanella xiamenensis]